MQEKTSVPSRAQVRRRDRAVTDNDWIRDFLKRAPFGTLATIDDRQPFANMNIFVYDEREHAIYLHTARAGRTRDNIEAEPQVCFSVAEMGRLLPAPTALHFSVEYAGVVVFGRARVVADDLEAEHALQQLLDKYAPHLRPGRDYRPIQPEELAATTVYRIEIEEWSGKQKVAPPDHRGAFTYAGIVISQSSVVSGQFAIDNGQLTTDNGQGG
ncbi:MAG: pyridoxamine 5'-phosphate oxidase family protein [Planctomycetes bacterium]|nr:pyridoxamine 5'-phosphate oxidase family protein [Planctomycetota bacterium]